MARQTSPIEHPPPAPGALVTESISATPARAWRASVSRLSPSAGSAGVLIILRLVLVIALPKLRLDPLELLGGEARE